MTKCIIIDDEPLALDLLEDFIGQIHELQLVARCNSAAAAQQVLNEHDIQVMFLDIHMPDIDGIRFLQSLPMTKRPLVILTTAFNQYAIESYELDVADYLMKPFSFERFLKAVHKVISRLSAPSVYAANDATPAKYIFVKAEYKTYKINLDDIIYIEGLKDYSKIYTVSGNTMTLKSLKSIETMLPKQEFMRVHRSYIIAINKIRVVSKNQITTIANQDIPVSEGFRDEFNSLIHTNHI